MPAKTQRISDLILQEQNGTLDDPGRKELDEWLALSEDNRKWHEQVVTNKFYLPRRLKEYAEAEAIREEGWNKIAGEKKPAVYVIMRRRIAVAAAVSIIVSMGAVYWWSGGRKASPPVIPVVQQYNNDVLPGGNKAILTLGNGAQIVLDTTRNGALAQQGNSKVSKLDSGQIAYNLIQNNILQKPSEVQWNVLSTPRGGQYRVVLADGTKVWLNAASSLRFPSSFSGPARRVMLTGGEAYFEVAKNKSMPFIVTVFAGTPPLGDGRTEIEVLGTHFDLMAYEDEKIVKTTLLEGAVKVKSGTVSHVLSPGQRAQLDPDGSLRVTNDPDAEGAIAWTNGFFQFKRNDIGSVMRQLARWYDVEIVYEGERTTHSFSGVISRDNNASDVLKALEVSDVHFRIEGKKIVVLP